MDLSTGGIGGYNSGAEQMAQKVRAFTLRDRIEQAKTQAAQQLATAKRAEEILQAHPEIEELINLLQRF